MDYMQYGQQLKTNIAHSSRAWAQVKEAPKQQDQQEERQEVPKGSMTIIGPTTWGQLWPPKAPQLGPKGLL